MSAALELDALLHDSLAALSLPDVYLRLREVMESDDSSMADAAKVLSMDAALAARALRIANSPVFGFRSQVETVSRAASILGMQEIHNLALAASVSHAVEGLHNELMDLNTFWYRSVHCAFLAKAIAEGANLRHAESLFIRGLLHDIGHLLLFTHFPEKSRAALASSDQGLQARLKAEDELMGINAIDLVAQLGRNWGLPNTFVESFEHLLDPHQAPKAIVRETAILHIAVQISCGLDSDLLIEQILEKIPNEIWQLAELPPEVGNAALEASTLEMVDAMYQTLSQ